MAAPTPPRNRKSRLGEILVAKEVITPAQLKDALARSSNDESRRLGDQLVALGCCTGMQIAAALAEQFSLPLVDLRKAKLKTTDVRRLPEEMAFRNQALCIGQQDGALVVALADPTDAYVLEDLRLVTGGHVRPVVASAWEIRRLSELHYWNHGEEAPVQATATVESDVFVIDEVEGGLGDLQGLATEALVVKWANQLLRQSLNEGASDIHIEPFDTETRIRVRVDGVLRTVPSPPKQMHNALVSRIKVMAEMDIAERRLPQDGRIKVRLAGRDIDVRISTLPTLYGEGVVMRLLDRDPHAIDLGVLGFPEATLKRFQKLLKTPYGIILATGPTGSGKTTTLYAALQQVSSPKLKVITVEDPVEYRLPGVNQMHVRPKIGLTFAQGLRHILRQDPDIIMVGEIRDVETAEIAIHSALTGHLVFSTLHTNDSAGAVGRLLNMGIEPFLVAGSVEGVLAQRLVRRLCPQCKEPHEPNAMERLELSQPGIGWNGGPIYRAVGCGDCRGGGYRGRVGLYELLVVDEAIEELIIRRAVASEIKAQAQVSGMISLREEGWRRVAEGVTSVDEVSRVTHEDEAALGVAESDAR